VTSCSTCDAYSTHVVRIRWLCAGTGTRIDSHVPRSCSKHLLMGLQSCRLRFHSLRFLGFFLFFDRYNRAYSRKSNFEIEVTRTSGPRYRPPSFLNSWKSPQRDQSPNAGGRTDFAGRKFKGGPEPSKKIIQKVLFPIGRFHFQCIPVQQQIRLYYPTRCIS